MDKGLSSEPREAPAVLRPPLDYLALDAYDA
jgi:hypothetical protein